MEFGTYFLLEFTRQLIKNSGYSAFYQIEGVLKEKEREEKEQEKEIEKIIKEKIQKNKKAFTLELGEPSKKQTNPFTSILEFKESQRTVFKSNKPRVLRIPEPRLPQQLQYLKPFPTNLQIDLGKLNVIMNDQTINTIECSGANEIITVQGSGGIKNTSITFNEEEIKDIIERVARAAKIPFHEGVFTIVYGTIKLAAIISEEFGSKFIITKLKNPNNFYRLSQNPNRF